MDKVCTYMTIIHGWLKKKKRQKSSHIRRPAHVKKQLDGRNTKRPSSNLTSLRSQENCNLRHQFEKYSSNILATSPENVFHGCTICMQNNDMLSSPLGSISQRDSSQLFTYGMLHFPRVSLEVSRKKGVLLIWPDDIRWATWSCEIK